MSNTIYSGKAFKVTEISQVLHIKFDLEGERVNKFNEDAINDFEKLLEFLKKQDSKKVILFSSAKKDSFIVGADINLIQSLENEQKAVEASALGQKLFSEFEDLPNYKIVAINGPCMGGGTELALAFDNRICSSFDKTMIGLPEVKLGLLPGWGGTYRMPLIVGSMAALDVMTTGKNIRAKKALKMGLVSAVIPFENFENTCLKLAQKAANKGPLKKAPAKRSLVEKLLTNNPLGRAVLFSKAKAAAQKATKGHYPAPFEIIDLLKNHTSNREKQLKNEARAFGKLWATSESRNLINLFFMVEENKKSYGAFDAHKDLRKELNPLNHVSVLGAGVMGGGIAAVSSKAGYFVIIKDIMPKALLGAFKHAESLISKMLKRKRITKTEAKNQRARISGQLDYSGFKSQDLVIEAVVENVEIKRKVYAELEKHVRDDAIIATNTSSLRLEDMKSAFKNPERFIGLHFFNPVDKMPLVEVVYHPESSPKNVIQGVEYTKKLGKTPVVVKDGPGFLVNRLLLPWLIEAGYCFEEGYDVEDIDKKLKQFGMPMGPFELLDAIGLDVAAKVGHILHDSLGAHFKPSTCLDHIVEANKDKKETQRLGQKSGLGFYKWNGNKKIEFDAAGVYADAKVKNQSKKMNSKKLVERMIFPMINETAALLKEGIAVGPHQVDLAMIFGTGFPPFRGGLCRYADSLGLDYVIQKLESMSSEFGDRLKPNAALKELQSSKGSFY